jgi:hypothetical protein
MTAARWRSVAACALVLCLGLPMILIGQQWPSSIRWLIVAISAVIMLFSFANLGWLLRARRRTRSRVAVVTCDEAVSVM